MIVRRYMIEMIWETNPEHDSAIVPIFRFLTLRCARSEAMRLTKMDQQLYPDRNRTYIVWDRRQNIQIV